MDNENIKPVTLTIAGSDSGGGAGIQADLKTFTALGTFGTSAITCLTSQNPSSVTGILEVNANFLEKQILAVLNYFPVKAIKTGMLFSTSIIETTSSILSKRKKEENHFFSNRSSNGSDKRRKTFTRFCDRCFVNKINPDWKLNYT
ncbi:Phosphomethylpyrimidine kinase domain protein [Leptospira interrogans]|nr:Phosphomethylpyrimidine kinase domain protein [Leptospira interrogans]